MTTLQFKCTLLSDVILNQKAATEGPNQTLDFIPGSCFLGIAAGQLYKEMNEETMEIFHSGKVRFGDAHPSNGSVRGLKIPASMFYPKLKKITDGELYIYHLVPQETLDSDDFKKKQIKQCRSGFYTFVNNEAKEVKTETNFAIKSAYDKDKRRSKDEQMYGYQSLQKGLELLFEVEVDNDALVDKVKNALKGEKRVGRSRTAQYGLVKIEESEFKAANVSSSGSDIVTVYADGRLIFLDECGIPTFRPTAEQLGFQKGAVILWNKSQIRTFQYSPWNFHRQCFDADRCGIEKGSVFVVKATQKDIKSQYVGSYKNEGFGKVIYNPEFLCADKEGKSQYKINEDTKKQNQEKILLSGTNLLNFINKKQSIENRESNVYAIVNDWIKKYRNKFKGETFASQWGAIRSIAMKHIKKSDLEKELFTKTTTENGRTVNDAYLTHGVAADKWNEKGRLTAFRSFFDQLKEDNAQIAIINLAAEMAKEMKR